MDEIAKMVREKLRKAKISGYNQGITDAFNIILNSVDIPLNEQLAVMEKLDQRQKEVAK